jgi:Protein of unknown function (DUF2637)
VVITTAIAAASFVLSFTALRDLAARAGVPRDLAWLWPTIVDGTILQATMAVVALAAHTGQRRNRRFFWTVLAVSAGVSIGANGLHAIIPQGSPLNPWIAAAIATVAPTSLLVSTHGLVVLSRINVQVRTGSTDVAEPVASTPSNSAADSKSALSRNDSIAPVDRGKWEHMAVAIQEQGTVKDAGPAVIADVLHLTYDREWTQRAIGRHIGIDHRAVGKIVNASSELLRCGEVRIASDDEPQRIAS